MTDTPWPEDRVAALRSLWNQENSASQIAAILGDGVTRNAVIGKLDRLGLIGFRRADVTLWRGKSFVARREPTPPRTFSWENAA